MYRAFQNKTFSKKSKNITIELKKKQEEYLMSILITVGREFGSGGRELGRRLADELGIEYYDNEILEEIVAGTSYSKAYVQEVLQAKPTSLYPIHFGVSWAHMNAPLNQTMDVYAKQNEVLHKLADASSCVIIGRAADYILKDHNPFRIFVYAEMDSKIARCRARAEDPNITDKEIIKNIKRIEKNRRSFYNFYTNSKWGAKENYDLLINTTGQDIKKLAHFLALSLKEEEK